MYRVIKAPGKYYANVTVENIDTKASVIIGRITTEILNILEKAGYTIGSEVGEGSITMESEWNLLIDTETANTLSKIAMKMKKPIRDQSKKVVAPAKDNKHIDAIDVLLGLAQYDN